MRAPMRLILLCTILILNCPWAPYGIAQTLSPEQLAHQTPDAMPHSGALVGLSGGQTLWIAPVDNKIRVLGHRITNDLFPVWGQIKATYPDAEDAFSSPSHDLLLVTGNSHLIIVPVYDGKIRKPLADIDLFDRPVMVQWAIGKYVDAWTSELTPYFHAYGPREAGQDPKVENEEGLKFMQRRQPMSAIGWFVGAARADSANAEYTNNAGFAYYQMGKYGESVLWLEKTISIDPKHAVAYLNLGDAYAKLRRNDKARQAYTKYLELAPDSKSAPRVKKKLDALSQ